jgi:eukaryotic-like serine/threonine-protein kinase
MINDGDETLALDVDPAEPLARGAVLNRRYRLDQEVGRGNMGIVYRGTDLELRRSVAVKILPAGAASDDRRQQLLHEARAVAMLNHPNVVAVYDVGEARGIPFLVMELVYGSNLAGVRLASLAEVVDIASQICRALAHAHARGIVHRDLKPQNVLLIEASGSRTVKVADLGLAVPIRGSDIAPGPTIAGTVDYMSPEQAMGDPVDGRADLYALGAVLYELTTGRPPFAGDHPLAIISQHVNAPVVPPRLLRPDLPPQLDAIIVKLLAKSPDQRYATAEDLQAALQTALDPRAIQSERPEGALAALDALSRGRLVGRVNELGDLQEFWRRARQGRSHCVLLSGEPGTGKTRLGRELIVQAALQGAVVLSGACYEYEANTPYLPFAEAFRTWVRDLGDVEALRVACGHMAPQLAQLAPEIEGRLGPFPPRPALAPHEERLLFFDAVVYAFRQLAAEHGLLFYVDDLHWGDSSTLWLFGHVLRHLRDARVLLVASYRETELDRTHPLAKALVDWNRDRVSTRIVLRRFSEEETRAQLTALLDQEVDAGFAGAIHRETEGNPFFVEEMLKALIEHGSVRRQDGGWKVAATSELQLPESIKAAIARRLDRVAIHACEILRRAAVLGKVFEFGELTAAVADEPEDALLDALDEGVAAQLLVAGRNETFAFTHDKIREVLYEELNPIRRRRIHLRTAEGLERHRERAPVPVERLAHHFIEAGEHTRGLVYAKESAAEAERVFAHEAAIAAYGRALECAQVLGMVEEQAAIEEAMGAACSNSGEEAAAVEHFERALELVSARAERARLHCRAAASLVVSGDPRGLEYVHLALAALDPATHPIEVAHALAIEGRFHHLSGRHRKAIELLEQAAALAMPLGHSPLDEWASSTVMQIYGYLAGAYQHLGLFRDADAWARRAVEFGVAHGVLAAEALGYEFLAEDSTLSGDSQAGLEYAQKERDIADRIHSRERRAWTSLVVGICAGRRGETDLAERDMREGLGLAEMIGERRLEALLLVNLAIVIANAGRADEALQIGNDALAKAESLGLVFMRTEARRALAHVRFRRGDVNEALRLCEEVLALTEGSEPRVSRLMLGPLHVDALLAAGRVDDARLRFRDYEALAAKCQSSLAERELARLRADLQRIPE